MASGQHRINILIGSTVDVILQEDRTTGKLTRGHVKSILTNCSCHQNGIKVMLAEGNKVGRVQHIITYENEHYTITPDTYLNYY